MGRCTAKTKAGKRCKASAIVNSTRCVFHMPSGIRKSQMESMRRRYGKKRRK